MRWDENVKLEGEKIIAKERGERATEAGGATEVGPTEAGANFGFGLRIVNDKKKRDRERG